MTDPLYEDEADHGAGETIAGLLAAAAIALSVVAVAYRPGRLAPAAVVLALVAAAMTRRWSRLGTVAVAVAALAWFVGMTVAVVTDNPIF